MRRILIFALPCLLLAFLLVAAPLAHAAIVGEVEAHISHPFIIADATLPPGTYVFRMLPNTDLEAMTVKSANGSTAVEFLTRPTVDSHIPKHSELVFDRYGNKEFLKDIFEGGYQHGEAVVLTSREEARLQKQGEKPFRHTEEQEH